MFARLFLLVCIGKPRQTVRAASSPVSASIPTANSFRSTTSSPSKTALALKHRTPHVQEAATVPVQVSNNATTIPWLTQHMQKTPNFMFASRHKGRKTMTNSITLFSRKQKIWESAKRSKNEIVHASRIPRGTRRFGRADDACDPCGPGASRATVTFVCESTNSKSETRNQKWECRNSSSNLWHSFLVTLHVCSFNFPSPRASVRTTFPPQV